MLSGNKCLQLDDQRCCNTQNQQAVGAGQAAPAYSTPADPTWLAEGTPGAAEFDSERLLINGFQISRNREVSPVGTSIAGADDGHWVCLSLESAAICAISRYRCLNSIIPLHKAPPTLKRTRSLSLRRRLWCGTVVPVTRHRREGHPPGQASRWLPCGLVRKPWKSTQPSFFGEAKSSTVASYSIWLGQFVWVWSGNRRARKCRFVLWTIFLLHVANLKIFDASCACTSASLSYIPQCPRQFLLHNEGVFRWIRVHQHFLYLQLHHSY